MKRVMMALGCAAVTMFAGCMCDQMAARDLQPKEAVECPEIRSECFSLSLENIATNRIELTGWLIDGRNHDSRTRYCGFSGPR